MQPESSPVDLLSDLPILAPRSPDAHKGTFGQVFALAGSRGMSGAAILCGSGALRGGAGLVRVAVPEGIFSIVAAANPCYMTLPLQQDEQGRISKNGLSSALEALRLASVGVLGPGLGQSADLSFFLKAILKQTDCPLVLDADALNLLPQLLTTARRPMVLTPHPGEFARLIGTLDIKTVQANRLGLASDYARKYGVIVVLKGHGTIVTDGRKAYINTTGNPGMAKGGSGDVLGGLLAALISQGLEPFAASQLAVYLHGLAGDLARDDLGEVSLIATDILDYLPQAFLAYQKPGSINPK